MTFDYTIKLLDRQIKHLHIEVRYHAVKKNQSKLSDSIKKINELEKAKILLSWKPCGDGENTCNCKHPGECGYLLMEKELAKLDDEGNLKHPRITGI